MAHQSENEVDRLWREYSEVFQEFDDLRLARWLAQTLSQLQGRAWRLSHPLVASYRLAAMVAHDRQIWQKRLVTIPSCYSDAGCCGAPLVPLLSRDAVESGLVCIHCSGTALAMEDLPEGLQLLVNSWAEEYSPVHAVAHWDDARRGTEEAYERALDDAAKRAETLLTFAARQLAPKLLEHFAALVWEDQDECLDVRPDEVTTR